MKSKFKLIIMTLFGMLSLFSIGFASWVLTKPIGDNIGSIEHGLGVALSIFRQRRVRPLKR